MWPWPAQSGAAPKYSRGQAGLTGTRAGRSHWHRERPSRDDEDGDVWAVGNIGKFLSGFGISGGIGSIWDLGGSGDDGLSMRREECGPGDDAEVIVQMDEWWGHKWWG